MTLPFDNETSKIIKKLSKRSLAADRRRNLFVILTIALAVCLMSICAFLSSAGNAQTIEQIRGQYQSGCNNLTYADIDRLVGAGKFEKWGYENAGGVVRYKDANVSAKFADPGMLDLLHVSPITGSYPQTENEICVERAFLKYFELPEETGQSITMDAGYGEQTYTVSGILEKENDSRLFDTYISEAAVNAYGGDAPFTLRFRFEGSEIEQPEQLRADIAAFYTEMGISEYNIFYSSAYFGMSDLYLGGDMTIYVIALLVAIACAVVIYSIFYISVMGKMREYGRLKVIGATPKQLKRVVRRERTVLTLIGIPIGLVAAALLSNLLKPGYWVWATNLKYAAIIATLTYLVVLLSTRKPLMLVGKVSAIEAVRTTAYSEQNGRGISKRLHRRLTMPRLAAMNFSRNKKKSALTLLSLGLTGILAISVAAYANSIDAEEMAKADFGDQSDYLLNVEIPGAAMVDIQKENPLGQSLQTQLANLPDVSYITAYAAACATVEQISKQDEPFVIAGYTPEQMAEVLPASAFQAGAADYDSLLERDGILVARDTENLLSKLYHADFAVGDTVTLNAYNGQAKTYTVMGIVNEVNQVSSAQFFILPEKALHTLYPEVSDFTTYVNVHAAENSKELRQDIFELAANPNISISSVEDYAIQLNTSLQGQLKIYYGVVVFVALFALLNLINTLMTNLISRQREFGVFQSVGMSNRQLSQMLSHECLLYVGATLLITLTIGTLCSMAVCRIFDQLGLFGKISYHFPTVQILIFAAALLLIQGVFSIAAVRYSKRHSLVERIKIVD